MSDRLRNVHEINYQLFSNHLTFFMSVLLKTIYSVSLPFLSVIQLPLINLLKANMLRLKLKTQIFIPVAILIFFMLMTSGLVLFKMQNISPELNAIAKEDIPFVEMLVALTKAQLEQTLWFERVLQQAEEIAHHQATTEKFVQAKNEFHKMAALVNSKLDNTKAFIKRRAVALPQTKINQQLALIDKQSISYENLALNIFQLFERGKFDEAKNLVQQLEYEETSLKQEIDNLLIKTKGIATASLIKVAASEQSTIQLLWWFTAFTFIFGIVMAYLLSRHILTQIGGEPLVLNKIAKQLGDGDIHIPFDDTQVITGIHHSLRELTQSLAGIVKQAHQLTQGNCSASITPRSEKDILCQTLFGIAERLKEIILISKAIAAGDYTRQMVSKGQNDLFGQAINQITKKLQQVTDESQKSDWLKTGQTKLNEKMRGEQEIITLTQNVLNQLAAYLNAQVGLFFLAEEDHLKLMSSYAYKQRNNNYNEFKLGEGLIGQAAFEKKSILFTQAPAEHINLSINSGMGESQPYDIFVLPLIYENEVLGVLELAVARHFTSTEIELLDQVADNIAISIYSAKSRLRMKALLEESQELTLNLQNQQQEVLESEERIRAIIDTVIDAIITIDTEGIIDSFNPAAEQTFGYSWSEIVGQNVSMLMPEPYQSEHDQYVQNYLNTGQAQIMGKRLEAMGKRKDGSSFPIDIAINEMLEGEKRMFIGIVRDITEQKKAEAALREQQEELQTTNEELQAQQEELQSNNEELQTQQEELRIANNVLEERGKALEESKQALEEKARALELSTQYKSEFFANMSHELRTPLNSLLILAQLLVGNKEGNLNDKQVEYARTIHSAGSDLLGLINDILDLSKAEAGKMEANPENLSLSDFLESINQKFYPVAENKGLAFSITLAEEVPPILYTDAQRLTQIMNNLLSNAFKFTSQGDVKLMVQHSSQLNISSVPTKGGDLIAFSVIDSGIGIPKEKQADIFDAFKQADGSTSRRYGGTGLGLSISRQFANLLDGELQLVSEEGKGSSFTLYLPDIQKAYKTLEVAQTKEIISPKTDEISAVTTVNKNIPYQTAEKSETVVEEVVEEIDELTDDRANLTLTDKSLLIIEDDRKFSDVLMELANEKGFKCLRAGDGQMGLQLAAQYQPNAIILDVGLPKMNGWSVMENLKENPKTRHIPVHFMSAATDQEMDAKQMGAIGYLLKPINIEQLGKAFKKIERFITQKVKNILLVVDDESHQQEILDLVDNKNVESAIAMTKANAIQQLYATSFDCIIIDLDVEQESGIQLLEQLCKEDRLSQIPVIVYADRDLKQQEEILLRQCGDNITVKSVRSQARLLEETTLFLHQFEANLSEEKRDLLHQVHDKEAILRHKKVLIVDDDIRNLFALVTVLEDKEMEAIAATNGQEALDFLEKHPDIAIVLMDLMMPEMDGYEAMRKIRKQPSFYQLPIIALTAKAMKGDRGKCIEAGANDYLAKPVDSDKLLSLLRVWLYR
jgi:PAS domain S-box-containing protein